MGFTFKPSWPASGNALDADLDQIRDHWHYVLSIAASGSIVIPGWQTTVQGSDKSQPDSITLTRGTKKIIIYYTWSGNSVSAIQFCYDNGVGETSPSVTCYPAISFFYDETGNPVGTTDPDLSDIKTSLVSWWTMNETSGNRADSHGSVTLTDTNTVGYVAGVQGNAASFVSASTEWLTSAAGVYGGATDMAIALWVYFPSSVPATDSVINHTGAALWRWELLTNAAATKLTWRVNDNGGAASTAEVDVSADTWYFIYCYLDASAGEIGISLNDGTPVTHNLTLPIDDGGASLPINFGRNRFAPGWNLTGYVDEAAFWYGRVLTATEVTALYNAGAGLTYTDLP